MRILVLASTYPLGPQDSTPGFVHELCRRLAVKGHQVFVLTPHMPGAPTIQILDGVHVHRYRYCPEALEQLVGPGGVMSRLRQRRWRLLLVPFLLVAMAWNYITTCRRRRIELVHAHWLIPQGLVAAAMRPFTGNLPLVCTAHGGDLFALRGPRFRSLRRLIVARANVVALVSNYMRDVLASEGVASNKLEVAPMGVDLLERFVPDPQIARNANLLVFVGRLVEKKGVRHLLDAFAEIRHRHVNAQLRIIGDGPERAALERQADVLGIRTNVEFLGARPSDALPAQYSEAAIAVVPSVIDRGGDQEGLGLVTIEAAGCGCALVVSDLDAIRDVVSDKVTALVTKAGDHSSLAMAIDRLLDDPALRERLADAAKNHVRATFDWTVVTERYESLFQRAQRESAR